jgi:hypothetical protein
MSAPIIAAAIAIFALLFGFACGYLDARRGRRPAAAAAAPPRLADERLARLLDQDDDLADLGLAEIKAVEDRGRDHQAEVRGGIYRVRRIYTARKRGG